MIYPAAVDDLSAEELDELTSAQWEPSPVGGGWWRDPQSRRDYTARRALELARRDLAARVVRHG